MMNSLKYRLAFVLCGSLAFSAGGCSQLDVHAAAPDQGVFIRQADRSAAPPLAQAAQQTSEQLQQLLAPIALYPDPLLAQILAASTYPTEVVEAWRWMQKHSGLKGQQLANAVDPQPWDPSVKALTQFPSVLDSMNKNLRWTSALGDAYVNEQQDVLDTLQTLRQRAQTAGRLQNTSQQTVTTQDQAIAIEPTDPQVVYVPAYDPWLVYGAPFAAYPGWVTVPGIYYAGPDLYFGTGFAVGLLGFGWGWNHWGFDWYHRQLMHEHAPYFSHSKTFAPRHDLDQRGAHFDHGVPHFDHGAPIRGGSPERTPTFHAPAAQGHAVAHSGAFSGFDHGGIAKGYSSRGRLSFGGAGALRAGGAFHGGGGSHGGGGFGGGSHGGGGSHR